MITRSSQTGDIKAVVGSRLRGDQGFNRAVNAKRQVGSLMKPVVYLTALESDRYHLATVVDDTPLTLHDHDDWAPRNFDGKFRGPVPMFRALGDSLNVATVRLGIDVGVERIARRISELTAQDQPAAYPSLLLGAVDMTPFEVSELYAVFASGGFNTPGKSVIAVHDEHGGTLSRYPIQVSQVIDPNDAASMTRALQIVMERGTGRTSRFSDLGIAGKTGTSNDYRDSWFAGFDANLLSVVWVGRDDNASHGLSGSKGAMAVWDRFAHKVTIAPAVTPVLSDQIAWTEVDYRLGKSARASCADVISIPIPRDADLPRHPGCGVSLDNIRKRVRKWFE